MWIPPILYRLCDVIVRGFGESLIGEDDLLDSSFRFFLHGSVTGAYNTIRLQGRPCDKYIVCCIDLLNSSIVRGHEPVMTITSDLLPV